jgi:hypothetical protein
MLKSAILILVLFTNIHLRQNNNSVLIEIRKEELHAYNINISYVTVVDMCIRS